MSVIARCWYEKPLILYVFALAVVPAFSATLVLNGVDTNITGTAKAGSTTQTYSSTSLYGAVKNPVSGNQEGYASSALNVSTGVDTIYGSSASTTYGTVSGVGNASGSATAWALVKFTLTEDAWVTYSLAATSSSAGGATNTGSLRLTTDASAGGTSLAFASLGDFLTGTVLLEAGDYSVEVYSRAGASARSRSAAGSAFAYASSSSDFALSAEAVPEPASMAVLALGGAALLRRRKKA